MHCCAQAAAQLQCYSQSRPRQPRRELQQQRAATAGAGASSVEGLAAAVASLLLELSVEESAREATDPGRGSPGRGSNRRAPLAGPSLQCTCGSGSAVSPGLPLGLPDPANNRSMLLFSVRPCSSAEVCICGFRDQNQGHAGVCFCGWRLRAGDATLYTATADAGSL